EYIKSIVGEEFTAKDFRTWAGTLLAAQTLRDLDPPVSKKAVTEAVKRVSQRLGNTPAVCRASYIHPAIIESAAIGELAETFRRKSGDAPLDPDVDEAALLRMLTRKLEAATSDVG
ncbi:DNA topoisomerase IB, partial [bacterium]